MHDTSLRSLPAVGLLLLASGTLAAQQAAPTSGYQPGPPPVLATPSSSGPTLSPWATDHAWPPIGVTPAAFSQIVALDHDGDLLLDAIVLDGGVPVLATAPSIYRAFTPIPGAASPVRAIDRLRGVDGGHADGLVALTDLGLELVTWTDGNCTWTSVATSPAWQTATQVRCIALTGAWLVLGLTADQHTVVSFVLNGSGWGPGPSFVATADVRSMAAADWDADGVREIVLETTQGLEPFELRGAPRSPLITTATSLGIAVLPGVGGAGDVVAWVTDVDGALHLSLADSTGIRADDPLDLPLDGSGQPGPFAFVALAAGDVDRDGDADLHITQSTSLVAVVLRNGDDGVNGPSFAPADPGERSLLPLDPSPYRPVAGNTCPASFADYDGDGTADALSARADTAQLHLEAGIRVPAGTLLLGSGLSAEDIVHDFSDFEPGPQQGRLHLVMHVPPDYLTHYQYVQVVVWPQAQPGADLGTTASFHAFYQLNQTTTTTEHYLTIDSPAGVFPAGASWSHTNHFYVVFRFVKLVGGWGSDLSTASPPFAFGMTLRDTIGSSDYSWYLLDLPDAGDPAALADGDGPPRTGGGRTVIGSIVIQRVLPPPPPATPLDPTPPEPTPRTTGTWDPETYW